MQVPSVGLTSLGTSWPLVTAEELLSQNGPGPQHLSNHGSFLDLYKFPLESVRQVHLDFALLFLRRMEHVPCKLSLLIRIQTSIGLTPSPHAAQS